MAVPLPGRAPPWRRRWPGWSLSMAMFCRIKEGVVVPLGGIGAIRDGYYLLDEAGDIIAQLNPRDR